MSFFFSTKQNRPYDIMRPFLIICILALACSPYAGAADAISFRSQVAPVLIENCVACHGAKKAEGGYRIDTFEYLMKSGDSGAATVTAEKLDASELYRRLVTADHSERMPADSEPLAPAHVELVKNWISSGAAFDGEKPTDPLYLVVPPAVYPDPPAKYPAPIPISSVAFSLDGSQIYAAGYHELTCWSTADGTLLNRIKNIGQRVYAISVSPDGTRVAVGCGTPGKSGEVRIVDIASGKVILIGCRTTDVVLDVVYSPNGERLAVGGADGLIRIVDAQTCKEQHIIASHADWVNAVRWSADGKQLASASRDKSAKVYSSETGELVISYAGHGASVRGIAFLPDGLQILSVGDDKKLHRWSIEGAKKVAEVTFGGTAFKLAGGTDFVLVPSADKLVHRVELQKNQEAMKYEGLQDWALGTAVHPATGQVVASSNDGELRLWKAAEGTLIRSWIGMP